MIDICDSYSKRWRFLYNVSKCATLIFNENETLDHQRQFHLGDEKIPICENYSHLGIDCTGNMLAHKITQDASVKIKGTYMSIVSKAIGPVAFNANTLITIYNSAVLPKALYGSELWCIVSAKDLSTLQKPIYSVLVHVELIIATWHALLGQIWTKRRSYNSRQGNT